MRVAVVGSQSLSFLKARCTEFKSSGGRVTFWDRAIEKWPARVQREVTEQQRAVLRAAICRRASKTRSGDVVVSDPGA